MTLGWTQPHQMLAAVKLLAATMPMAGECPTVNVDKGLLSDEDAERMLLFLNSRCLSQEAALQALCDGAQQFWLRSTFKQEGVNAPLGVNVARWFHDDSPAYQTHRDRLLQCVKSLGYTEKMHYHPEEAPDAVLLLGGLQSHLEQRIPCIAALLQEHFSAPWFKDEPIVIHYLSGPRGVFHFEPGLRSLLIEWLQLTPDETSRFDAWLERTKHNDWRQRDTDAMKLDLLADIGRLEDASIIETVDTQNIIYQETHDKVNALLQKLWPQSRGFAAKAAGATSPYAEKTAGWPVAADLAEYLLRTMPCMAPFQHRIVVKPVIVAVGPDGKLPGAADSLRVFKTMWESDIANKHALFNMKYSLKRNIVIATHQPHGMYLLTTALRIFHTKNIMPHVIAPSAKPDIHLHEVLDAAAKELHEFQLHMNGN